MATPENDLGTLQLNTIIESTATPGQYGVVVLNSIGADISSGGGGGGAVTIANGADVVEGNTADVKVVGDNAGTVSAKLRGLNTTLSSVDGKITTCNTGAVVVSSSALPTGASTSALQSTGNTSLASIDTKTVLPATLGQKTMANSLAVVVASDQSAIPISGSITASNASIGLTGAVAPTSGTLIGGSDGTNLVGVKVSATGVVSVDGSATTQPVSGTVTANLGTIAGVSTEATLSTLNGKVTACNTGAVTISAALPAGSNTIGNVNLAQYTPVTGRLPVDGSGVTQPISAAALPLPALAATSTQQSDGSQKSQIVDGSGNVIGSTSNALDVNIKSGGVSGDVTVVQPTGTNLHTVIDSGTLAATQSGTWNITNVSGTVSLPTGASTEATLSTLNGKVTACNTGAVTISAALPAGANAIGTVTAVQSTASNLNGQMVGNVASAASDSGNPVKVGGVYNSSAPTFTNGQRADLQVNSNGSLNTTLSTLLSGEDQTNSLFACATKPISGSTYTATINTDFGTVVTLKVKNAAGNLFSLNGHNNNAATRYLQIHNTTTALTGGEVPFIPSFVVPTGSQIILGPTDLAGMPGGLYCSTGITWGWSTTKNTYTAATAGDHMTGCSYV